jgi:integrase
MKKVDMGRERKGTILERNGKIYARVRFKDENGKLRDLWRKAESKSDARKKLKQLVKESEELSAIELDSANMTLAELAEHYIKNYLQEAVYVGDKKVSGVRGVEPALYAVKPLVEYFGSRKIKSITYGDIRTYKQIRFTTPTKHGKQRSIAAVNKELGKLKRMFNIAVREQWLSRSAFDNGESLIGDEIHRNRILTMEEEARLFQAIESKPQRKHLKGIVLIALDCSLRRGEIFKLCWSEVNLEKRTITVTAFNSKNARERTVAMTRRVFNELESLWEESNKDTNKLVFGINVTIKTSWRKICREAKIEDFRFHDCRHTAISRMVRAGIPPVECMKVSGHLTLTAFNIYANIDNETIFRIANALDSYLASNSISNKISNAVM